MKPGSSALETKTSPAENFFISQQAKLVRLLALLGEDHSAAQDIDRAYKTMAKWQAGDHWTPNLQARSIVHEKELNGFLKDMGLVDEILPPNHGYDEVIVLGATMPTNLTRVSFLKELVENKRITINEGGHIVIWAGQRPLIERDLRALKELGVAPKITATEAELARLALEHNLGETSWQGSRLHVGLQPKLEGVPFRGISNRRFKSGALEINILNAAAVERPQGQSRHTSHSSALEWLRDFKPKQGAKVLIISSNPHILRVGLDVEQAFADQDRPDLAVESCGAAAPVDAPPELFLGEIARLLHQEINPNQT